MRAWLLAALILVLLADTSDARRRHRHYSAYPIETPETTGAAPFEDRRAVMPYDDRRAVMPYDDRRAVMPYDDRRAPMRSMQRAPRTVASLAPDNWQVEAADPNWNGKRFLSPDGASWFAVYRTPAAERPVAEHMKNVIFADGETITYLRAERGWIVVAGFQESRAFYRKAILACAGKSWHHVALEYPIEQKPRMDLFAASAAQALDDTQSDCNETVSVNRP